MSLQQLHGGFDLRWLAAVPGRLRLELGAPVRAAELAAWIAAVVQVKGVGRVGAVLLVLQQRLELGHLGEVLHRGELGIVLWIDLAQRPVQLV